MDFFLKLFLFFSTYSVRNFKKAAHTRTTYLPLITFSISIWNFRALELHANDSVVQEHEACEEHLLRDCGSLAMLACDLVCARENPDIHTTAKCFSRNTVLQHWLHFIHTLPELLAIALTAWHGIFLAFADSAWFQNNCFGGLVQDFLAFLIYTLPQFIAVHSCCSWYKSW